MEKSVSSSSGPDAIADLKRSTIAVVGLGGIGGVAAGCLRDADRHDVIACVHHKLDYLTVERPEGTVVVPLRTLTDPIEATPVDWVLLCTKAHQTASAAAWLRQLCRPATRVAVLQNGIGHGERVAPFIAGAEVVPAIVYYNGERLAPDRVRLRHVIEHDLAVPDDAAGRAFAELLDGTPLRVSLTGDFITPMWQKLLINAVVNPITALTRQRLAVLRREEMRALCLTVLDEAVAVARAEGARLAEDEALRTLATLFTYPAEAGTSMYFDCLAGRSLEVDALTGAIVAAGERHQIATPLNRAFLLLLRAISDAAGAAARVAEAVQRLPGLRTE
jgi:2-dehydropantoate 2-reductase